jgi:hypothetical protein
MTKAILMAISCLFFFACMAETAPQRDDLESNGSTSTANESAEVESAPVQIPPELLANPSPRATCTISGGGVFNNGTCFVQMTCHDQFNLCFPSFCALGRCNGAGTAIAATLCNQNCRNANCAPGNLIHTCQ